MTTINMQIKATPEQFETLQRYGWDNASSGIYSHSPTETDTIFKYDVDDTTVELVSIHSDGSVTVERLLSDGWFEVDEDGDPIF